MHSSMAISGRETSGLRLLRVAAKLERIARQTTLRPLSCQCHTHLQVPAERPSTPDVIKYSSGRG